SRCGSSKTGSPRTGPCGPPASMLSRSTSKPWTNQSSKQEARRMYGDLEAEGDLWRLRFRRQLPHPPERVWRAITEPEHLQAWFPQRIVGRWQVGGMLRF